jgi:hypothetical protein
VLAEELQLSRPMLDEKFLQDELLRARACAQQEQPIRRATERSLSSRDATARNDHADADGWWHPGCRTHRIAGAPQVMAQIMLVSIGSFARDGSVFTTLL